MNFKKIALARVLNNKDSELFSQLSIKHFTDRNSKTIYRATKAYFDKYNKLPSASVLSSAIENQVSGKQAKILTGYLESIELIETSDDVAVEEIIDGLSDGSVIKALDENLEELVQAGEARDIPTIKDLLERINTASHLGNIAAKEARDIEFSVDNIKNMDSFIPSMRSSGTKLSGVVLVSGSSGGGKSILAMNQALYSYKFEDADILYMNLELSANEQMARMLSHVYGHPFADIYRTDLQATEVEHWNKARTNYFGRRNKFKMINVTVTRDNIINAIEQEVATGLDLVVIDYLQIVDNDTRHEQWLFIQELVKDLHKLALRLGIVILTPIQINLSEVKEENNSISLTTRGSRELEFSSSLWVHIHQTPEEYEQAVARLFTIKSRQSRKHIYMLETHFDVMSFMDTGVTI